MSFDQIWLLSRGLQSLRSSQAVRQCLVFGSAAKLVNSALCCVRLTPLSFQTPKHVAYGINKLGCANI